MPGTNDTEHSLSATETANDTDFAAIQQAVLKGDSAELDRLMAAQPVQEEPAKPAEAEEKEEVAVEEEKPEEVNDNPEETSNEDEKTAEEADKTEAAKSAASTATKGDEDVEALKRELHRYKSDAGRMAFVQRRMAELEREVRAYKAREVAPTQANGKVDLAKVEIDPDLQKEIDELKEIDPVLARTMERVAKTAMAAANERVEQAVTQMTQADTEADDARFYQEQKSRLVELVPQADAIFATPEWQQWKQTLLPGQRAMAESGYADEVYIALQSFAADMQRRHGAAAPAQAQAPAQQVANPPEKTEVTEARERKIATSAAAKSTTGKKAEQFDEAQMFREIYNQVAKQNHIL